MVTLFVPSSVLSASEGYEGTEFESCISNTDLNLTGPHGFSLAPPVEFHLFFILKSRD